MSLSIKSTHNASTLPSEQIKTRPVTDEKSLSTSTSAALLDSPGSSPRRACLSPQDSGLVANSGTSRRASAAELREVLKVAGPIAGEVGAFGDASFSLDVQPLAGRSELSDELAGTVGQLVTDVAKAVRGTPSASIDGFADRMAGVAERIIGRGESIFGGDIEALVQMVLRESYMESSYDLRDFAEKVKFFNATKKAIRGHLGHLRKIEAQLAGVSDEDSANTRLDGTALPGSGSAAVGGNGPGGESVHVESGEQRARDYPEAHAMVAEFTSFRGSIGRTDLERYLMNDPSAAQRLIAAVPYMTGEELASVLGDFGGLDMKVNKDVKHLWGEILDAASPGALLEVESFAEQSQSDAILPFEISFTTLDRGELAGILNARIERAKAHVETALGQSFGSRQEAAAAWAEHQAGASDRAAREAGEFVDESTADAIASLLMANSDGPISAAETVVLLRAATEDFDAQAAGIEFDDLKAFIEANSERLTPGAKAVFEAYSNVADEYAAAGESGIPKVRWDEMMVSLEATAVPYAEADLEAKEHFDAEQDADAAQAEATAAEASERASEISESLEYDPSQLDLDASDGAIDAVAVSTEPPFIKATGEKIQTKADLGAHIKDLEERLSSVGDDAQLANVDLQNALQRQQQTLQMMSNISKMLHDGAMNTIRKIGG